MAKVVRWDAPKISSAVTKPGHYRSYSEFLEKANMVAAEQEAAQAYLLKAMAPMVALLEYKLTNGEPLTVMRPLRYRTSELNGGEEDDGFYKSSSSQNPKFKDVIRTILPGTQLMLKSLDMALQEFVFTDAMGKEHSLNFDERNNLLTQTDIYEEVKKFLEVKGE
jgi:RsiW-degrading membrane proteinase PrsW (M82 family)